MHLLMYFGLDSGSLTFNNVFGAVNVPSNLCSLFKCIHSYRRVPGLPGLVHAVSTLFIKMLVSPRTITCIRYISFINV